MPGIVRLVEPYVSGYVEMFGVRALGVLEVLVLAHSAICSKPGLMEVK